MSLIELENVVYTPGGAGVLDGVGVTVAAGARLMVLGPSGCGKTSLLHVISGLLRPDHGAVRFDGRDLAAMDDRARSAVRGRHFGMVFQRLYLLRHLSVADNVRLGLSGAGLSGDDDKVMAALAALGLADKAGQKAARLSHGEAQRVAIARAVVKEPSVILADEPTSALDDDNAAAVIGLLEAQAARTGAALVVATHDARITARFDTVIHMKDGRIAP